MMDRGYVSYGYVNDKKIAIYAIPKTSQLNGEYNVIENIDGYIYIALPPGRSPCFKEGVEVEFSKLPDEQSFITFFPFDLLLGRKRKIIMVIDEILRRLRGGSSLVTCFYKGCRKPALFYAEAPQGLEKGGCWYACSKEHFSPVTSKGIPVREEDYKRLLKLEW